MFTIANHAVVLYSKRPKIPGGTFWSCCTGYSAVQLPTKYGNIAKYVALLIQDQTDNMAQECLGRMCDNSLTYNDMDLNKICSASCFGLSCY